MDHAKRFTLEPTDGRKSFYGKCYVLEICNFATLYSYDTKIMTFNTETREITKHWAYNYSLTTRRHQKAFCKYYGITDEELKGA